MHPHLALGQVPRALALLLALCPLAAAQSPWVGHYELAGSYPDGRASEVRLGVELRGGQLVVERREQRAGESLRWRASAARVVQGGLQVTYRVPAGGDVNELEARYALGSEGRLVRESLTNTTRRAPETWGRLETAGARSLRGLSYGELAGQTLPPLFAHLRAELSAFGSQTFPHEAKALRKLIGKVRLYVDLFCFAYPRGSGFDPWRELRESLDEGYEALGAFKDLYDAQGVSDPAQASYDAAELDRAREPVLRWLTGFRQGSRLDFFAHYLATPKARRLYARDELSPYFWGAGDVRPERGASGLENLARLQRVLLAEAREDLSKVARIKDEALVRQSQQEHFHSLRKALRGTVKISEVFPELYRSQRDPAPLIARVDEVVARYGAINDLLVAHGLAERRDQRARARDLAHRIEREWDALKKWQDDERIDRDLRDLRRLVLD